MCKIYKKILTGALLLTLCVGIFPACGGGIKVPRFSTSLTIEEQIAKIKQRTEEKYPDGLYSDEASYSVKSGNQIEWVTVASGGEIESFSVDILYSFDEKPRYFLVEFKGAFWDVYKNEQSEYAYTIGYIVTGNEYYQYSIYPKYTQSPYKQQDLGNEKKYYGYNIMAVKNDADMVWIGSASSSDQVQTGGVISESQLLYRAKYDYRLPQIQY